MFSLKAFLPLAFLFLLAPSSWAQSIDSFRQCQNCNDAELNKFFDDTTKPYEAFTLVGAAPLQDTERPVVILLHGLSDSPYYLKDVAKLLFQDGYDVVVPLVAGHGNQYAEFEKISQKQWLVQSRDIIHQVTQRRSGPIILGGFSNGGLLAYELLAENEIKAKVEFLLLFSPALQLPFMSKIIGKFGGMVTAIQNIFNSKGLDLLVARFFRIKLVKNNCTGCTGQVRYENIPINGLYQVQKGSDQATQLFKKQTIDTPTFLVLSSDDTVINTKKIVEVFQQKFTGPKHLFWIQSNQNSNAAPNLPPAILTIVHSETPVVHSGVILNQTRLAKSSESNPAFKQMAASMLSHMGQKCIQLFP